MLHASAAAAGAAAAAHQLSTPLLLHWQYAVNQVSEGLQEVSRLGIWQASKACDELHSTHSGGTTVGVMCMVDTKLLKTDVQQKLQTRKATTRCLPFDLSLYQAVSYSARAATHCILCAALQSHQSRQSAVTTQGKSSNDHVNTYVILVPELVQGHIARPQLLHRPHCSLPP